MIDVILVDDDANVLDGYREVLELEGLEVAAMLQWPPPFPLSEPTPKQSSSRMCECLGMMVSTSSP